MPKPTAIILAEFTQDATSGEWIATSIPSPEQPDTPRLSARAMQVRQARDHLVAQLTEWLKRPVQIEDKVKLPKVLAAQVAEYQRKFTLEEQLRAEREATIVPLAKLLLKERLQMQQVAGLLRLSKAWLGQVLKRDATGSYR